MKPMSIESAFSASISDGPALNCEVFSCVPPSSFWKRPSWSPTRAVACVRFGKYPIRTVSAESFFASAATFDFLASSSFASEP